MKNKIKKIRNEKSITLESIAKQTNLSLSTVIRIENGTIIPKITTAFKIASALNTTVEDLFHCDSTINKLG